MRLWPTSKPDAEQIERSRTRRDRPSVTEVLMLYVVAQCLLLLGGLSTALYRMRHLQSRPTPDSSNGGDGLGSELAGLVDRTLKRAPADPHSIVKSLVLIGLLSRRGRSAELVLAVSPGPDLASHAWVESEGEALLDRESSSYVAIAKA